MVPGRLNPGQERDAKKRKRDAITVGIVIGMAWLTLAISLFAARELLASVKPVTNNFGPT